MAASSLPEITRTRIFNIASALVIKSMLLCALRNASVANTSSASTWLAWTMAAKRSSVLNACFICWSPRYPLRPTSSPSRQTSLSLNCGCGRRPSDRYITSRIEFDPISIKPIVEELSIASDAGMSVCKCGDRSDDCGTSPVILLIFPHMTDGILHGGIL